MFITGSALAYEDFTGQDWEKLNQNEKEIFLRGLQEGMNVANFMWIKDIFKYESFKETYNYMKANDRRIDIENTRDLKVDEIFKNNLNKSYIELTGKGYISIADNKETDSETVMKQNNEVEVAGYNTKIFAEFEGEPYNRHSKLYIHFKNNSNKTLTGVLYNIKLYDNFGDLIVQDSRKNQIKIKPDNTRAEYFVFTKHMSSNIYNLIANDTLKVEVNLNKAVFEDGSTVNFN